MSLHFQSFKEFKNLLNKANAKASLYSIVQWFSNFPEIKDSLYFYKYYKQFLSTEKSKK